MKYNGQELTPITKPQIFNPPKEMLVWDDSFTEPYVKHVCAITGSHHYQVVTTLSCYSYCAEIPEAIKPKRATNRELSEWVAKGNGLVLIGELISNHYDFLLQEENELAEGVQIQPFNNSATDWLEPTLKNMGMEE